MPLPSKIADAFKALFGFLGKREEARDSAYYISTIRRLRKKCQVGEDYIEADSSLTKAKTEKARENINKEKVKLKDRFRKFTV